MNRAVVYTLAAERDLLAIYRFIARDKPDAALAYVTDIREKLESLAEFPMMGRAVGKARLWPVQPNALAKYRVLQREVEIIRIVYAGQGL
ncbi:type II toxin-antitoxin system RelE/ParE family toxin [Brevundimonas sp.]|uniref:type II toxin-antitoxin system RelE/ParE family toxin n=1 Tax=Brevundimonas sp. TaxID=1871086 RepID=UPI002ABA83CF|nr:type II toxin-antitoxin system RelE/ParE family toxin [Brevundimonas sp.]MDZ4365194.1 type II toxin-antitoxin system RelE/ParE family toxin [Brevundimonas sp.]